MTIANAFREFFYILNGVKPTGMTIADVVRNGTSSAQRNNESALTDRMIAADGKSFVLNSSTAESEKRFSITVTDDGTITATEIDENGDPVAP